MSEEQTEDKGSSSQPIPNLNDQKRNSNRSKDSEIVVGQLNKIIRMKKQMKNQKIVIQDKIEKVREKSPLSQISSNKSYLDLKAQFTAQLPKLNSLDTRQAALKELEGIIEANKTPENLRVYLSTLSEYKRPQNFSTNEAEVFLLGLISDSFGTNLFDALDNPPSLFNASMRLGDLISRYFKDQNENVQRQCCKTWKQLYRSQLLNSSLKNKMMVLYEIPASIISGGKDRIAQITAVMVIEGVLDFAEKVSDKEFAGAIAKKYLPSIYFRTFLDTPSLVTCTKLIVNIVQIKNLQTFLSQILDKTISFLLPQETRPISYKIKIEVCDFLTILARQLLDISSMIIGQYQDQIIPILQECIKDRMLKVQSSAKQALKEWQAVQQKAEELEKKKLQKKPKLSKDYIDPDEIINAKTADVQDQVSQLKKRPKQQTKTIVLENENGIKNILNKQGGWVNELKAKNFIRKQTGVGGGRTMINEDKLKIQKTAINSQQQVRDFILGQYKDLRDDLKMKKLQSQENNEYPSVQIYEKQQIEKQSSPVPQFRQTMDNMYQPPNNENIPNNFYNSQIQNLQTIQKNQQQLIEEQLKLYPHTSEDRKFIVPPQTIYPSFSNVNSYTNKINLPYNNNNNIFIQDNNQGSSSFTHQKYRQAQSEYLSDELQEQINNNQIGYRNINQQQLQSYPQQEEDYDILEDTQDFNSPTTIDNKRQQYMSKTSLSVNLNKRSISDIWEETIQLADEGFIDEAFTLILDSEDDLYFIRLLMRTGFQLEKLKKLTAIRAVQRFLLIQKSNFVNKLCFGFYQNSIDSGLQDHLLLEDQREMSNVLGQLSQSSNLQNKSIASNLLQQLEFQGVKY